MKENHTQNINTQSYPIVTGSVVVYWQDGVRKEKRVSEDELGEALRKLAEAKKKKKITEFYHWKVR